MLNTLGAVIATLQPALLAGAPFGLTRAGTPATAPNEPLLSHFWLLVQWESPTLAQHLQSAAGVTMSLSRLLLSLLAAAASPPAVVRLVELTLWEAPAVPRCHPALLLCALLLRDEARLLGLAPAALSAALCDETHLPSALEAERLHTRAVQLCASMPSALRAALDAAWCGTAPSLPLYPCAWLEAAEIGAGAAALGRVWVVDVRPDDEYEAAHYALTTHLPPAEARQPVVREATRAELFHICLEGGFTLALVTSADPAVEPQRTSAGGAPDARLSNDEVRLLVHEFVGAGFRHVGILRGGVGALSAEQRASLVAGSDVRGVTVDGGLGGAHGAAAAARDAAARLSQRVKERFAFTRRRAKPSPSED